MGVDLAASVKRKTGVAFLSLSLECSYDTLYSDEEIINYAKKLKPEVIVIDAPLSVPKGRRSIDDRNGPHFRKCDLELKRMKIKFFPITLGPMRELTKRGMSLASKLRFLGFKVIESYPGGVQDVLKIPRKKDLKKLIDGLIGLGLKGCSYNMNDHEADAATIAYLGVLYLKGKALALGDPEEGLLYLPSLTQA